MSSLPVYHWIVAAGLAFFCHLGLVLHFSQSVPEANSDEALKGELSFSIGGQQMSLSEVSEVQITDVHTAVLEVLDRTETIAEAIDLVEAEPVPQTNPVEAVEDEIIAEKKLEDYVNDQVMPEPLFEPAPEPPVKPRNHTRPVQAAPQERARSSASSASNETAGRQSRERAQDALATGGGGHALASVGAVEKASFAGLIQRHLMRFKRYPAQARQSRLEGTARLNFRIDETGNIVNVRIERSSGHQILDDAALEMVRRASPFPVNGKPPITEFTLPVDYFVR